MEFLTEKNCVVCGVDKALVSELKRVYGCVSYQGEEYVLLEFPEQEDPTRAYRPDSYATAVLLGDEIVDGKVLEYFVTCTSDGHVRCVEPGELDFFGRPDCVEVE